MNQTRQLKIWRTFAIIFIILFILETIFIIWAWDMGTQEIKNEEICSVNICVGYDAYFYADSYCDCYRDNELLYTEYMG